MNRPVSADEREQMRVIGVRIKRLREAAGLTQAELAGAVKTNRRNVTNWETGKHSPRSHIGALEKFFGVSLETGEETGGDAVHRAVWASGLSNGRVHRVLGVYEDAKAEQARESLVS